MLAWLWFFFDFEMRREAREATWGGHCFLSRFKKNGKPYKQPPECCAENDAIEKHCSGVGEGSRGEEAHYINFESLL